MSTCSQCRQPIEGNKYEDAISVGRHFSGPTSFGYDVRIFHFECVEEAMSLANLASQEPAQFSKWAIWAIKRERDQREALEKKLTAELETIHRALHALPYPLNEAYMAELYDANPRLDAVNKPAA